MQYYYVSLQSLKTMTESILKDRFLKFALAVYRFTKEFPKETVYFVITNQILRCSSTVKFLLAVISAMCISMQTRENHPHLKIIRPGVFGKKFTLNAVKEMIGEMRGSGANSQKASSFLNHLRNLSSLKENTKKLNHIDT